MYYLKIIQCITTMEDKMDLKWGNTDLNNLVMICLDYYKDGIYARDPDATSQSKAHHNAKAACEKSLFQLFTSPEHRSCVKYISSIVSVFQELQPQKVRDLKSRNSQLLKENSRLKDELKIARDGAEGRGLCGTCYYRVDDHIKREVDKYKSEHSEEAMKKQCEKYKERIKQYSASLEQLNAYQKNINDNYHLIPIDEWREMKDKEAREYLDDIHKRKKAQKEAEKLGKAYAIKLKKKYEKVKKENLKLKCKILQLQGDTSSSSEEVESDTCSD